MYRPSFLFLALFTLFALPAPGFADAPAWDELGIPAGGRIYLAGGRSPGQVALAIYFHAGTATAPAASPLPLLAPRAFLDDGSQDFASELAARGWSLRSRCDLDGAGVFLAGPRMDLEEVLTHLLERLEAPAALDQASLDRAWERLQEDWERWSGVPEVALRETLAARHYGEHPYAAGLGRVRPETAVKPKLEALRAFLAERYQAGGMVMLIAGDLDPAAILARWQTRFDALPGVLAAPPSLLRHAPAGGEHRQEGAGRTLMLLQFPGPPGGAKTAAATAVLAGVLSQRLHMDIQKAGLGSSATAWYDFTSPGPQPVAIQVRDFPPGKLPALRVLVDRIVDRMRHGEFSEYQVITAKDIIFQQMDAATGRGEGVQVEGLGPLMNWGQQVLRHALHFHRWRVPFERRLMDTGKPEVIEAAQSLSAEQATLGLLLPSSELD